MHTDTVITRSGDMLEAEIGGELVGLDVERGTCFGFNATAAEIWRLLERPHSFDSLCEALLGQFEVDPQTCRREVAPLLGQLRDEELITLTEPA